MNETTTKSRTPNYITIVRNVALSVGVALVARQLFAAESRKRLDVRGKVVLITGGSRGLGFALAQEFGQRGAIVALCARDQRELDEAVQRLQGKNIQAKAFADDIADKPGAEALIARVIGELGRIDVLVNNAGTITVAPMTGVDHSEYEKAMNLMFWAPVNLSLAVVPHMTARGEGHIVNITSVGGRVSIPHLLPYSCAKFALVGFSTGMSSEAKAQGIHVLTVVPGLMRTGSYLNADFAGAAEGEYAWFSLLGNLPGFSVAADYAASQVFEALEQQRYNCTISLPAKVLIAMEALAPEATRTILAGVNRLLPGTQNQSSQSGKTLNPNFGKIFQILTTLGRQAALHLNQGAAA